MPRLFRGPDPRLAVVMACGLDPTLIPSQHCEVGRDTITYRTLSRDDQGAIITDDDGCPILSESIIANRRFQS